jgi:hypothetical protein
MMGIDHGVAHFEVDALDYADNLEILEELLFFSDVGDGVPPSVPGLLVKRGAARSAGSDRPG